MARAITSPTLWTLAYSLYIAGEAATGLILAFGSLRLALCVRGPAALFNSAKPAAALGIGLGFLVWFTGFSVVGGEWFAMWQSREWNGVPSAFRFTVTLLLVLIFVMQPVGD